ncbi:hypothetical protein U1Q18_025976 [Sarracenia purpurea var. burkii]
MGYQWDEANQVWIPKIRPALHQHKYPAVDDPLDDQDSNLSYSSTPPLASQPLVAPPLSDSFEEHLFAHLDHMEAYMIEHFGKLYT